MASPDGLKIARHEWRAKERNRQDGKDIHVMITPSLIEQRRSPRALRDFVVELKKAVKANEAERHCGIRKKGLYKKFLDEIVPLSLFALQVYPENHEIQPVLGNQGYDALVFNEVNKEVDRIEMTIPHDGSAAAKDARVVIEQGYGQVQVGYPGDDFDSLFPLVLATCRKKSIINYYNCTLVVAIVPMSPFKSFEAQYEKRIVVLASEMAKIRFKAKRVFLFVLPDRVIAVDE
jgi:hypothetical protein